MKFYATKLRNKQPMKLGLEPVELLAVNRAVYDDLPGTYVELEYKKIRSPRMHRLFFALLEKVVENHPFYFSTDQLLAFLKVKLGYVEEVVFHNGTAIWKTKSIAFDKMDQAEFQKFFNQALDVIVSEVLPEVERGDLLREVEEMIR